MCRRATGLPMATKAVPIGRESRGMLGQSATNRNGFVWSAHDYEKKIPRCDSERIARGHAAQRGESLRGGSALTGHVEAARYGTSSDFQSHATRR